MNKGDMKGVYNIVIIFKDKNNTYWIECIYVHLMSVYKMLLFVMLDVPFISKGIMMFELRNPKNTRTMKKLRELLTI